METILAFLAGYMLNWYTLGIIFFIGIIAESNDAHGWSVFFGLVAATISYFVFSVSLVTIAWCLLAYVPIGIAWSIWRYKRHVSDTVERVRDMSENDYDRVSAINQLHPSRMLSTLTTWVIAWPFSMIENVCGDFVKMIQTMITTFFKGVYHKIYNQGVAELKRN